MASLKWKADFLTCALVNSRGQSFMTPNPTPLKKKKEQSRQWLKTSVTKSNGRNNSSRIDIDTHWHNIHYSCDSQLHSKKTVPTTQSWHKHNFLKPMRFERSPNAQHRTSVAFPTALSSSKPHGYHALLFSLATSGEGWASWLIGHDSGVTTSSKSHKRAWFHQTGNLWTRRSRRAEDVIRHPWHIWLHANGMIT